MKRYRIEQHAVMELEWTARREHADPFASVELDLIVRDPRGRERIVPAFWSGGAVWRARYSSSVLGEHGYRTRSSDALDAGLHAQEGVIEVGRTTRQDPLSRHGPIRIGPDERHFVHEDGSPFLWLADTWWLAFVRRFRWPDDVRALTADRVGRGFSVVQLVAGLYPEMPAFDERGEGDAGWPWRAGFESINPDWWDAADLRLSWIVDAGIVPCVVGAWGFYLPWLGMERMRRHWRYLVARWGAYPVVWCLAGEARLPWYDSLFQPEQAALAQGQATGWAEIARYVRAIDPYERPLSVHPSPGDGSLSSYDIFEDRTLFDFVMLQTGHWDRESFEQTLATLQASLHRSPDKPVLNSEVCYEGILGSNWQDTQRFLFWTHMLSGAAGHSYGAQGVWGLNDGTFVGHVGAWSDATWLDAHRLPGSRQVGIGRRFLERFDWQRFEPHPEWVEPHWTAEHRQLPYAAGIGREVRVIYLPSGALVDSGGSRFPLAEIRLCDLEPNGEYSSRYFNPRTGADLPEALISADELGEVTLRGRSPLNANPTMEDWVLVLRRMG